MFELISGLGLDGTWLPILVSLIIVPALYIILATDVHQEYGDVVRALVEGDQLGISAEKRALINDIDAQLEVFNLEWWIVAAFGFLIVVILASGNLGTYSNFFQKGAPFTCPCPPLHETHEICDTHSPVDQVRVGMSLYATAVGLVIAFAMGWARLELAQRLRTYFVPHYERPAKPYNLPEGK